MDGGGRWDGGSEEEVQRLAGFNSPGELGAINQRVLSALIARQQPRTLEI